MTRARSGRAYARQMTPADLVGSATARQPVPMVPEISLLTAVPSVELWDLWQRTGRDEPPFWAYPWAGGQALARYLLDNPAVVRGRRVLDVASGSGLVAIAAARAGAARVVAGDIDPHAVEAITVNAAANAVAIEPRLFDLAADDPADAEVILAGDVFYQRELAQLALRFARAAVAAGADVLLADPGRAFVPADSLTPLARYEVPVLTTIENTPVKTVTVYRVRA
jgi:predicted nicotinamide N-methyase